ncbi:terminal protein [Streptomyces griseoluteus]|uniref:Terminal protein n=2 Tax=Streptomyces TaxID=1883 RepID=A0A4Z1CZS6_STRGP|nr:terminal protein [Streptomyces griseoluteus]
MGEVYFRDNGHRAHGLEVELTDLLDLEFEL